MDRRTFMKLSTGAGVAFAAGGTWTSLLNPTVAHAADGPYGPLQAADANGLALPAGFTSRVVATTGLVVPGSSYVWHGAPDGGACFPTEGGGWVYVSNAELNAPAGGVGSISFAADGTITGARRTLTGTARNCAGGMTPWGAWLSCEEVPTGYVWETDPLGLTPAVRRDAMGRFNHEAGAVDPVGRAVYLTEDAPDGGLYRFLPTTWPDLAAGRLEVMTEVNGQLGWAVVPDPDGNPVPTKDQVASMRIFNGGEGAWFDSGALYFGTKGDNHVWKYVPATNTLSTVYAGGGVLSGVDNITVAKSGDLYVAEDGGNMELVVLPVEGGAFPFLRVTDATSSEITGPAFSPDGSRLYFSSQRNPGKTYEVRGPFRSSGGTTPPPAGFTLTASASKGPRGVRQASLSWSGATSASVDVIRNGTVVATTANDGAHVDVIGGKGAGSFSYQLRETGGTATSNTATVTF